MKPLAISDCGLILANTNPLILNQYYFIDYFIHWNFPDYPSQSTIENPKSEIDMAERESQLSIFECGIRIGPPVIPAYYKLHFASTILLCLLCFLWPSPNPKS